MLQAATSATLTKEQHFLVERTSALAVRRAAIGKILLGKEDLPNSATAPQLNSQSLAIRCWLVTMTRPQQHRTASESLGPACSASPSDRIPMENSEWLL
jgi:hypothetical protein